MPTYEYECDACGHSFELFQQMSESPKRKCPACARLKLRRLLGTGAAVIFKGSGFYQTDYRSKEFREKAKAEKSSAKKASSSESTPASGGGKAADSKSGGD